MRIGYRLKLVSPKLHDFIFATTADLLPIWRPVNSEHFISMPGEVHFQLLRTHIPHLERCVF